MGYLLRQQPPSVPVLATAKVFAPTCGRKNMTPEEAKQSISERRHSVIGSLGFPSYSFVIVIGRCLASSRPFHGRGAEPRGQAAHQLLKEELFLAQHVFHDPDLGPLAAVNIGGKAEEFAILARARRVEQLLNHDQGAVMMLNHAGQK